MKEKKKLSNGLSNIGVIIALILVLGVVIFFVTKLVFLPDAPINYIKLTPEQQDSVMNILKNENLVGFNMTFAKVVKHEFNETSVKHSLAYLEFKNKIEERSYVLDLDLKQILSSTITNISGYSEKSIHASEFKKHLS